MRKLTILLVFCLAFCLPSKAQTPKVGSVHVDSLIQYLPEFQFTKSFLGHYQYMLVKDVETAWNDISLFKKQYIQKPYISRSQASIYNLRLNFLEYRFRKTQSTTRLEIQEYKHDLLQVLRQQLIQELPGFATAYGYHFIIDADSEQTTNFEVQTEDVDQLMKDYLEDRVSNSDLLIRKQTWMQNTTFIHPPRIVEAIQQGQIINLN